MIDLGAIKIIGGSILCAAVLIFIGVSGFKQNTKQHGGKGGTNNKTE